MPKLLRADPLRPGQIFSLLGLHLAYTACHLLGYVRSGDALFALMMSIMLVCLAVRVRAGKSFPPPSMVLAAMGLVSGAVGAAWMAGVGLSGDLLGYSFAQRLLYQVFILLPLLGIGGYIFPMILGTENHQAQLSGVKASKAWKIKAIESLLLGALLISTYWIEVQSGSPDQARSMSWVRFALCFVWITKESGWLQRRKAKGIMPFALRSGVVCLLGGMVVTGIWQQHRVALDHSLYVGGFALVTMIVATRVLYGHSGQGEKFQLWIKPLTITTGLLLFTMLTRVTADFFPRVVISHHVYAAVLWVIVSAIWGIALLPSVRKRPAPSILTTKKKKMPDSMMDMDFRKK